MFPGGAIEIAAALVALFEQRTVRQVDSAHVVDVDDHDFELVANANHRFHVGDAVLCGTLAESYSMIQQRLRSAFPDRSLIWMNLINGALGYLPPEDLYGEDVYQVWQTPFAAGSLEQLIDEAKQAVSAIS